MLNSFKHKQKGWPKNDATASQPTLYSKADRQTHTRTYKQTQRQTDAFIRQTNRPEMRLKFGSHTQTEIAALKQTDKDTYTKTGRYMKTSHR